MRQDLDRPQTRFEPRWARRVAGEAALPFVGGPRPEFSLAYGLPDPQLFPSAELAEAATRVLGDPTMAASALQYGAVHGHPRLLRLLADKLNRDEGLDLAPENLLITSGSSAAIGLAARVFLDEGDVVLVEAPSFPGAMSVFRRSGLTLRTVPAGAEGIDLPAAERRLEELRARGERPRLLYTIPTFHNPTGTTLPTAAREALLELARRYDLVVLEDDAYRDLHFESSTETVPPSLYSLDREGRVVRTGTFSKILAPGVRLGWAVARPEIVQRMMLLKDEGGTNPFGQLLAVEFARDGGLEAHIARLVEAYRAKRDTMLAALERHFPPGSHWTRPSGGFFIWVTLPAEVDPARLGDMAREQSLDFMRGERCFAEPPGEPGTHLRLSFSQLSLEDIEEAVKRLGRAIDSLL